jgi:phage/plasmid-associated DNA primase
MILSRTDRLFEAEKSRGFTPFECDLIDDYRAVFSFDHSPCVFKDGHRSRADFLYSECLYGDIDDGMTIEGFKEIFKRYSFILYTSRNHGKEKKRDDGTIESARDRFHFLLPQKERITDEKVMAKKLLILHERFPFLCPGAKDSARFLFGNPDCFIELNKGEIYLIDEVEKKSELIDINGISDIMATDEWLTPDIKESLTQKTLEPFYSLEENRRKTVSILKVLADQNRWPDNDSWMALRGALKREGFSLSDFQYLSWADANCAQEWERCDLERDGATGGSLTEWCREVDPTFLKGSLVKITQAIEEKKTMTVDDKVKLYESIFREKITHGVFSDILYNEYHGEIIYEKHGEGKGAFFIRKEGACYWEELNTIKTMARALLEKKAEETFLSLKNVPGVDIKELCKNYALIISRARTNDFLNSTISLFSERVLVFPKIPWNETPECLPCLDRVLDFSGIQMIERDSYTNEYFINPVPCNVDEIISANESKRYNDFIEGLFYDKDTRKTASHCLSLCLAGTPSKTAQIWFNRAGDGGKNTLFDFLRLLIPGRIAMLKASVITAKGDASERRFGEAEAEGRTGIFFDELSMDIDICQIKKLTGLSEITSERKGRDPFRFNQTWALVMLCNNLPKFTPADDSAFLSRVLVLPFSSVFYQNESMKALKLRAGVEPSRLRLAQDKKSMIDNILQDRPGIIKKMVFDWIECRDKYGKAPYKSKECMDAAEKYRKENDEIDRFFDECFERGESYETVNYDALTRNWIEFSGNVKFTGLRGLITKLMNKYAFISRGRSGTERFLKGIREKHYDDSRVYSDTIPF